MPRPAGRLIGSVFDDTGKPIAGARIYARPIDDTSPGPPTAVSRRGHRVRSAFRARHRFVCRRRGPRGRAQREVPVRAGLPPRCGRPGVRDARRDRQRDGLPAGHPDGRAGSARLDRGRDCLPRWHQAGRAFITLSDCRRRLFGNKEYGSARRGRYIVRVVPGHRYAVRGEVVVKEPTLEGDYRSYEVATPPVEVDPSAPPPRLVLRLELEKCAEPGGVTVPARR